ncbi:coiled-coil alpha-helical rod 1-like [Paramuricea clavata]|uniref:Coiled-coil alpha-helical rod protein 1 n=1 Tax=Paramuricea clavata TaxID=317549 RepID=A0A6S7JNM5_PARCT|nr:coiled-coil alpha-helical rod 1-like [Paramuricea clavata]
MQVLTDENNTLHSTVKLLNVRLSAILEIVSIHETELTRHGGVTGVNGGNEGLLRTWREKVFALMVQLQSQKIVENETKRKEDAKISGLNSQLQELERSNSILNHKLADQEAAIELEIKKRTALQQENGKLREENAVFKKQEEQWSTHFQALRRSTEDVEKMLLQSLTNLNKTVSKLTSFDQRLTFAGSRIQFISEFLVHRDLQQKTKSYDEDGKDGEVIPDESTRENEEHLKSEVERLLKERAVLLNETKKHNQTLQEKTSALQEQYEGVIGEKNTQIGKLEVSESEKKERLHSLQDQLETKCEELEEASETIEELKLSLSKEKTTIEKEHREAMEKERLRNAEDMSMIEIQLNDVRREHAKAVAALKNAERQVSREKQQAGNMVANIEREYSEKLARCEKQLKSVEKERNLLMVRIREDRSHVVRSQPVTGRDNSTKGNRLLKPVKTSIAKQSLEKNRTQENTVDDEESESIKPIDAEEALTALKEIKVLSQQIVKLHDKSSDVSTSESEL